MRAAPWRERFDRLERWLDFEVIAIVRARVLAEMAIEERDARRRHRDTRHDAHRDDRADLEARVRELQRERDKLRGRVEAAEFQGRDAERATRDLKDRLEREAARHKDRVAELESDLDRARDEAKRGAGDAEAAAEDAARRAPAREPNRALPSRRSIL